MCVCYRAGVATEQHKYTVASVAVSTLGHMYISRYIYIYFFLIVTLMFLFMRDLLRSGDKCGAFCPADAECTRNNSATLNMVLGASSPDVNAKCNNMPSRQDPNPHTQTHYYFCRYKFCKWFCSTYFCFPDSASARSYRALRLKINRIKR